MGDGDARELAARLIVEAFRAVADHLDASALVAVSQHTADLDDGERAYVTRLVDSALVEVDVDWVGGSPRGQMDELPGMWDHSDLL